MRRSIVLLATLFCAGANSMAAANQLTNGGFETVESTSDNRPTATGDWSGEFSSIVTSESSIMPTTPFEGIQMLRFINTVPSQTAGSSDSAVWQLVDVTHLTSQIDAGLVTAEATAYYNRGSCPKHEIGAALF